MAYMNPQVDPRHLSSIEDSYLLLDAIETLYSTPPFHIPTLVLEVGTGSGIVSAFLKSIFGKGGSRSFLSFHSICDGNRHQSQGSGGIPPLRAFESV